MVIYIINKFLEIQECKTIYTYRCKDFQIFINANIRYARYNQYQAHTYIYIFINMFIDLYINIIHLFGILSININKYRANKNINIKLCINIYLK